MNDPLTEEKSRIALPLLPGAPSSSPNWQGWQAVEPLWAPATDENAHDAPEPSEPQGAYRAAALDAIGVDALIIQDIGVYYLVRKYFPKLELHASTQLAVHNRAGAETLAGLGFHRVVLARELTFE